MARVDAVVVGGGIVGLATALALLAPAPGASLVVLEKEAALAAHQTGHNSGVIHAGLYYKPGSLKATTCARGRALLERFCEEHDVRFERCGKVVVATRDDELPRLDELERRGGPTASTGVRRLGPEELREHEPHAAGVAALFVPRDGDRRLRARWRGPTPRSSRGAAARSAPGRARRAIRRRDGRVVVATTAGDVEARVLVGCAGLESDRVARLAGLALDVAIVPFRGEYWMLAPRRAHLVKNLIYPVPDPAFPFLGVHFTRRIDGGVEAGPNAVLALAREGYRRTSFDARDAWDVASWPGFWRMARRHWRAGMAEQARSLSRARLRAGLRGARARDHRATTSRPGARGARAGGRGATARSSTTSPSREGERMVHVLNAPSPAATASLAIGEEIAARALRWL